MKNDIMKIATLMTNLLNTGMSFESVLKHGYDFACKQIDGSYGSDQVMLIASESLKQSTSLMEFWPNTPCYAVKKEPDVKGVDETDRIAGQVIVMLESRLRQMFSEG